MLNKQPSNQKGATLIEAMVSVVIVAFGLLGLAGLLVKSTSMGVSAYNRTIVTQKIYEMADRIRLNPQGVRDGSYGISYIVPSASPTCTACGDAVCTAAEIASRDFCQWSQELFSSLSDPGGGVAPSANGTFTITVSWKEKNSKQTQAFDIQKYTMVVRP